MIDGFEPTHNLPESTLRRQSSKPRRPKKPKLGHQDGQRSGEVARGHKPRSRKRYRGRAAA